jgi:hypothetical protein
MGFIDNPIISALGAQLGLGGVFAAAGSPPDGYGDPGIGGAAPGASTPMKPGASKPNIPEYRNRPYIPRNENPGGQRGVGPGSGLPSVAPGVMDQATFESPEVQKLLGQYGVHPTDTPPDSNLFVHNPEAFVKHPVLSGLLEHGLRGLAYSHPGMNFLQSLVGGVRGIQESDTASAQQQNNQLTAPFQQAGMVAQLQKDADAHTSAQSLSNYHEAMAKVAGTNAQTRAERLSAIPPRKNALGQQLVAEEDPDNPGKLKWTVDPSLGEDPEAVNKAAYFNKAEEALTTLHHGDASQITPEERQHVETQWLTGVSNAKSSGARSVKAIPSTSIHIGSGGTGSSTPKLTPQQTYQLRELDRQEAQINKQIASSQKGGVQYNEKGDLLVPGSAKHKAYLSELQTKLETVRAGRQAITGGGTPQAQPSTPQTNSNPFRH